MALSTIQLLAAQTAAEVAEGRNLSDTLTRLKQQRPKLTPAERGALQDLAFGVQRFSGSLNAVLDGMTEKKLKQRTIRSLILVALYQLAHTRNAPHAVINEAVRAAATVEKGRYKALTNALLRRFQRERQTLLDRAAATSGQARHNLPDWWLARLKTDYPDHWQSVTDTFNSRPPLTLRVNRRRNNAEGYLKQLNGKHISARIIGSHALILDEAVPVSELPEFADGTVSVQDWGAQQAAHWLAPQNGERILDACAAPGGKSGHLLELADCRLTAIDIDETRLQRVRDNLDRLQLTAEDITAADAAQWASCYDGEAFDAILADVPCTASGVVRRHPDIKWLRRPQDPAATAAQQTELLDRLWQILKPGGRMLLATCSLFPEENADQLAAFLTRHDNARCLHSNTLLPDERQDGFYYALISKQTP